MAATSRLRLLTLGYLALSLTSERICAASASDSPATKTAAIAEEIVYQGCCDASAAIAMNTNWVAVASDEDSRLRIYERHVGGPPVQMIDLRSRLELDPSTPETDIEGAARVGDRVYWITSHARNKDGKLRPNRHRFFATEFRVTPSRVEVAFVGRPYKNLLADLVNAPALKEFNFIAASRRAPKEPGALNIEGLCATADGRLLIGFRNPVPGGRALLVPLKNADAVIRGQPADFGAPILIDLGGLGIRDIVFHADQYVIVAGSPEGGGREKLFAWAGGAAKPRPFKSVQLKGLNPEAVVIYSDKGFHEFQLFSDDSSQHLGRIDCGELNDPARKQFRSVWIGEE